MIALNDWREQLKVQVRIHPSWTGVEWCLDAFSRHKNANPSTSSSRAAASSSSLIHLSLRLASLSASRIHRCDSDSLIAAPAVLELLVSSSTLEVSPKSDKSPEPSFPVENSNAPELLNSPESSPTLLYEARCSNAITEVGETVVSDANLEPLEMNAAASIYNAKLRSLVDQLNNKTFGDDGSRFIFVNNTARNLGVIASGFTVTNASCCPTGTNVLCVPNQTPCQNRTEYVF
ncbi:hypothetical protein DEO72_LG5g1599 [Vigna unguiculata]|uniref:Uncharacterized protein n=1 Tax=Vigna unguiculata TaxID=3917 RepID=A0A4D6M0B0_VIGUN|nr:hypothetical protein DEO72_LG5g1599 [Vigna unguiculata]